MVGRRSVLVLDDAEHMSQRKLLLPPFHGERMKAYGELMTEVAEAEIATWPAGEPVATRPRMQRLTLEIVMRAIFGVSDTASLERLRSALNAMLDWTMDPSRLLVFVLAGPKRLGKLPAYRRVMGRVNDVIYDEIAKRRRVHDLDERADILSMLLATEMTERELRDELMTLLSRATRRRPPR